MSTPATATTKEFPLNEYVAALANFLEKVDYHDDLFTPERRLECLRYVYYQTASHFEQPIEKAAVTISSKRLHTVMRTSTLVTVYCWARCPLDVMAGVSIYFAYIIMLDDSSDMPNAQMTSFCEDLIKGHPQKHMFWQRMNAHLTGFLRYYGGFCAMTIFRSTLDFFQGCWIEQNNFGGFPGSGYFPHFLRRLNGLGGISSATLFPRSEFKEEEVFQEIVTAIAQIEPQLTLCNDLISFYKEFDSPRDQINLVSNIEKCHGVSWDAAFGQLTSDTILYCDQLVSVFKGKDPKVEDTVRAFVHGYVTWHFCDPRFRMDEVYKLCGDSEADLKFRKYYEAATSVGTIDFDLWATPPSQSNDKMTEAQGQISVILSKMVKPFILKSLSWLRWW